MNSLLGEEAAPQAGAGHDEDQGRQHVADREHLDAADAEAGGQHHHAAGGRLPAVGRQVRRGQHRHLPLPRPARQRAAALCPLLQGGGAVSRALCGQQARVFCFMADAR